MPQKKLKEIKLNILKRKKIKFNIKKNCIFVNKAYNYCNILIQDISGFKIPKLVLIFNKQRFLKLAIPNFIFFLISCQVLIRRRPRAGTKKRRKKKGPTEQERRKEILAEVHDDSESDSSSSSTPRRRRSTSRKSRKPSLKKIEEEDVVDVYDGEETEDYWFFVDRWFDSSEDDKAIERELLPTDEQGKALHGLEGMFCLNKC